MLRLSGTLTSPSRNTRSRWYNEELRDGSPTDTITHVSSVSDMLHTLGCRSREHRRATSRLYMLFQIYHGSIGIPHDPYIPPIQTCSTTVTSNICTPSQHTSAGLTNLNVLSSPKQLSLGMHSLKVWSLAPHWMHSRRQCHWGDRYQASVFEHTNLSWF